MVNYHKYHQLPVHSFFTGCPIKGEEIAMSKQDKSIEKLLLQDSKLTPKQKRFCEEFPRDLIATQAAIRAGYSKKSAYSIGEENLKKPKIQN